MHNIDTIIKICNQSEFKTLLLKDIIVDEVFVKENLATSIQLIKSIYLHIGPKGSVPEILELANKFNLNIDIFLKKINKIYFFLFRDHRELLLNQLNGELEVLRINHRFFQLNLLAARVAHPKSVIHRHSLGHAATCAKNMIDMIADYETQRVWLEKHKYLTNQFYTKSKEANNPQDQLRALMSGTLCLLDLTKTSQGVNSNDVNCLLDNITSIIEVTNTLESNQIEYYINSNFIPSLNASFAVIELLTQDALDGLIHTLNLFSEEDGVISNEMLPVTFAEYSSVLKIALLAVKFITIYELLNNEASVFRLEIPGEVAKLSADLNNLQPFTKSDDLYQKLKSRSFQDEITDPIEDPSERFSARINIQKDLTRYKDYKNQLNAFYRYMDGLTNGSRPKGLSQKARIERRNNMDSVCPTLAKLTKLIR